MQMGHLMRRPHIRVTFGAPIPTTEYPLGRATTFALTTRQVEAVNYQTETDLRSTSVPARGQLATKRRLECRRRALRAWPPTLWVCSIIACGSS